VTAVTEVDPSGLDGIDRSRLQLLLDGFVTMAADLSLDGVLSRIVTIAGALVDARYAALGVLADEGAQRLRTFVHHGMSDEEVVRIGELPSGHGLLGLIIDRPEPLRLPDLTAHPASYGVPPGHPPMTSFLGVPVRIRDRVFGNLYLTEKAGGVDFSEEDERIVVALAAAAGVAIENARLYEAAERAREDQQRLALFEDRDRIGRDLHDLVIQRLFAVGLSLQGASRLAADETVRARLEQAVDDLDGTIKDIRRTIFALGSIGESTDVQTEVERLVERAAATLKARPTLEIDGPLRSLVPALVVPDMLAVLGEALSNASRHAEATDVAVRVRCSADEVVVTVADDGRGIDEDVPRSGLENMRQRALKHGGGLSVTSALGSGTTVVWRVPIAAVVVD
jgi:signal transduction histidine kinase